LVVVTSCKSDYYESEYQISNIQMSKIGK